MSIQKIEFESVPKPRIIRVAGYARVSLGKDAMLHSLQMQINYYHDYICSHPDWLFAGVYSDEAIAGTKEDRPGFQKMLSDCRDGYIDMIVTKSVSRFARNTVTLLETVRSLKQRNIDIYFEEQNIHTMSADGELLLTILAGYAEEEARSVSENMKWRIRKNFEEGLTWDGTILGYRRREGVYEVVPEEAAIVRRIFHEYLAGKGTQAIATGLNSDGCKTRYGSAWRRSGIYKILRNCTYTGNLLLQKTYRTDFRTKRAALNRGELPKFLVENAHEPIISKEEFDSVQAEIGRRAEKFGTPDRMVSVKYPFSGLIVCGKCGARYRHKVTATGPVWICTTFNQKGKKACPSKQIPEAALLAVTEDLLGSTDAIPKKITSIRVLEGNSLVFRFPDGTEIERKWRDRSRAESWSPQMRESARRKMLERNERQCREQPDG